MSQIKVNEIKDLAGNSLIKKGEVEKVVDNLVDLLTVPTDAVKSVRVLNYHSDVEGGGGVFYWDADKAKDEHNGGTVIDPTVVYPADWNNQTQLGTWFDTSNAGTGCWVRQSSDDGAVNVKWFGAKGDGVADSTAAIQAAFNDNTQKIIIPNGTYKITASLTLDGKRHIEGFGNDVNSSVLLLEDSSVIEAVKVGSIAIFSGGIKNLVVQRGSYDGTTENIGFAFHNTAGALFENITSRLSKYNFFFRPGSDQRVGYNTFINISGVGGFYNMTGAPSGTGWVNENVFLGGRMFTTANTNTNVHFGFSSNHNRWVAMSCEGAGDQAFYLDSSGPSLASHSNVIWNCRTEGTWAIDDVVLGEFTQRNTVDSRSLYTSVTDNGSANSVFLSDNNTLASPTNNSQTLCARRFGVNNNDVPVMMVDDIGSSTGHSFGILVKSGRDTADGSIIRGVRRSDNLLRFNVSSSGGLFASRNLHAGQSGWNFFPLKLGTWTHWINNNRLWKKNGEPANASDGVTVDSDQDVATAANIASATSNINTTNKFSGKLVWDVSNNRMMRASGATATSVWWIIDGSGSVTPA